MSHTEQDTIGALTLNPERDIGQTHSAGSKKQQIAA